MRTTLILVALALAVAMFGGCNAQQLADASQQATLVRGDIAAAQEQVDKAAATAAAAREAAATQPDGPEKDVTLAVATKAEGVVAKLKPIIEQASKIAAKLDEQIKKADPSDKLAGLDIAAATAPAIPVYGPIIGLILTTIAGFARAAYNRSAARAMAKGLELAQDPTGVINLADPKTGDKIRTVQGAGAGRIVDEAQGKVMALPF